MSKDTTAMGFEVARYLAEEIGIRFAGETSEARAADYVASQFRQLGYAVQEQPFQFLGWEIKDQAQLKITFPEERTMLVFPFIWSGSTPPEGVEGLVTYAGRMSIIELFEWDKYALTDPASGEALAYFAGREDGPPVSMAQTSATFTAPIVTMGREDFAKVKAWEAAGEDVRAWMKVSTTFKPGARSKNIIATLPGRELNQAVILCAHYDTQYNTPGAYDNASSVGLLLEIASRLRKKSFRRPIHFISFGNEEYLFVGSEYYVKTLKERGQLNDIKVVVNVDAILIGDKRDSLLGGAVVHHTEDDLDLGGRVKAITATEGVDRAYPIMYESPPSPSSDHAPFVREGIPAVKLFDAAPVWFHTPQDTFDRIDYDAWDASVRCVQHLVEELADLP